MRSLSRVTAAILLSLLAAACDPASEPSPTSDDVATGPDAEPDASADGTAPDGESDAQDQDAAVPEPDTTSDTGVPDATEQTVLVESGSGGTVAIRGLSLDIPPGALAADTEVTVRRLAGAEIPDATEVVSDVYQLLPEGLVFTAPVELALTVESEASGLALVKWVEDRWLFVGPDGMPASEPPDVLVGRIEGGALVAPIAGFSIYAVVGTQEGGGCNCLRGQNCDGGLCIESDCVSCAGDTRSSVPSGGFEMGCNPQRWTTACSSTSASWNPGASTGAYTIDRREVTVQEWVGAGCPGMDPAETTCPPDRRSMHSCLANDTAIPCECNMNVAGRGDHPMNCVTWAEADAYCQLRGGRLPTEAEWEKAARGTLGRRYPWGNTPEPTCDIAQMSQDGVDGCGLVRTLAVGSHLENRSPYGAYDTAGNVSEWTATWALAEELLGPPADDVARIKKGGAWTTSESMLRTWARSWEYVDGWSHDLGFRCVY